MNQTLYRFPADPVESLESASREFRVIEVEKRGTIKLFKGERISPEDFRKYMAEYNEAQDKLAKEMRLEFFKDQTLYQTQSPIRGYVTQR